MTTTKMGNDTCLVCNTKLNCATSIDGEHIPAPGDLSICIHCGEYLHYESDMKLGLFPDILFETLDVKTQKHLQIARLHIRNRYKNTFKPIFKN